MNVTTAVQAAHSTEAQSIGGLLRELMRQDEYVSVQVAVAYASVAGTRTLLQACAHVNDLRSEWLFGLDDYVTQPGAIDLVRARDRSTIRVASLGGRPYRFHPKVCRFTPRLRNSPQLVMVGSSNLTKGALKGNSESVVFLKTESRDDERQIEAMWTSLWQQGHVPAQQEITAYRQRYEAIKPLRRRIIALEQPPVVAPELVEAEIIDRDSAELDPSRASVCWIECGRVTAMGRELELKGEQGLFFGLTDSDDEKVVDFQLSNGQNLPLRLKYQENAMWRLQLNNEVPEVRAGLRPRLEDGSLGRSEMVAVFTRLERADHFSLQFLHLNSRAFARLRTRSEQLGTSSRTRRGADGRAYGWC